MLIQRGESVAVAGIYQFEIGFFPKKEFLREQSV
jgi:hypothetical protein